ncbi:hypothetical protein CEP54_016333 [Fusarium duplospermum]|uniref:Uncharacterized protein n=1 Tax=Fusarium duplospermum TaxID=1325734 RepID=A0A428NF75_9HYPO|nr:hypothetical protein CEP54_016333 [Fusarium duplospermum]
MSGDMQALTLVVDGVHMDIRSTSSGMEKSLCDHGSDRGETRQESFFVLSREAIKVVRPRRMEFLTLVKDAFEHSYPKERSGEPRFMQDLMEKVCDVFKLERVRVQVEVIGDDECTLRSSERRRHQEVFRFLKSSVWLPTDLEEQYDGEDGDDVTLDSSLDKPLRVSLRADEMEAFQCALTAKYLWKLLWEAMHLIPKRDLDLMVVSVGSNGLRKIWDDQSDEFNWRQV